MYKVNRKNQITKDGKPTGYSLTRGDYVGTPDDRIDRWYIVRDDATAVDYTGAGYVNKACALEVFAERD